MPLVVLGNLTAEISFASASEPHLGPLRREHPRAVHVGRRTRTGRRIDVYLGQQMSDQNGEWLLEFWNRSLKAVWSLDGTAQGPGPFLTP